jgi:sialic acid synthase SpsE
VKSINVVAELGSNWDNLDGIVDTISQLSQVGINSFKMQLLRADKLYSKVRAPNIYKTIKNFELPYEWLAPISIECKKFGLEFWLSVFDMTSADRASEYVDVLKIASGDMTNKGLVEYVAGLCTKKNISMAFSNGAASVEEIYNTFDWVYGFSPKKIIMFHCVSDYPASTESYRLAANQIFELETSDLGLSDHTTNNAVSIVARAMGFSYFEKHVMPNKLIRKTPDSGHHAVSIDKLAEYVKSLCSIDKALHNNSLTRGEQKERLWARRGGDGLRPTDNVLEE